MVSVVAWRTFWRSFGEASSRRLSSHAAGNPGGVRGEREASSGNPGSDNGGPTEAALQDTFGRKHDYLRISLTEKCNLRSGALTHLDAGGRARMVDVGDKPETDRRAAATARVLLSPETVALLRAGTLRKGDALATAELAGVMAAKRAAELIPLCHPLPLSAVRVSVSLAEEGARVLCSVRARARTGAEMEALTGAAVAALVVYDMVKSSDRGAVVTDVRVLAKSGGRSDAPNTEPVDLDRLHHEHIDSS